jgi:2-aminoadipate transaminase
MSPTPISFARGVPSLDILDVVGLREATEAAFIQDPGGVTGYGTAVGYVPLREWVAQQHGVTPEHVIVTNGSMQAGAFLFDALVSPGDTVIVENPTYDRTLLSLRGRGADVRPVELESDGIDVAALERVLKAGAEPKLAHIIPNFQNPAGYTLSLEKRQRLLALAAEHDFVVFEDDPYREVRFSGDPLPTMLSLDPAHVVYASSFSKIVRSGAFPGAIATVRTALAERAQTLRAALERELPEARFQVPEGGYFMWIDLPRGTDVNGLLDAALERGVQFVKGTDFMLEGGDASLRIAYSGVTPAEIEEGVARLGDAYRATTAPTADVA